MRKMTSKALATVLASSMVFSLTACNSATGNNANNETTTAKQEETTTAKKEETTTAKQEETTTAAAPAEVTVPEKITVMWDGTIFKEGENYAEQFYAALEEATGIKDIEFIRPDHSGYADQIMLAFADKENIPDVIILPAEYYSSLASSGALWDMTAAWENSETANSGRLVNVAGSIVDSWKVAGPDGEKKIYGMYPARGNGTVSYVKATWAQAAGYTKDTLPKNWEEYKTFLEALKEANGGKAPVMAPGAISGSAPYINYLPEFYQDAYPDFIYDEAAGQWIDGFSTDAMKAALERLAWGYSTGVINADVITKTSTSDVRNMYYADDFGIFNYWAGTWAYNIKNNLGKNGLDDECWVIPAIEEVGGYYERLSPMIAITSACENPEGVFKYFIDTMLDGGDVQMLWMYGVEDVHYVWNEDGTITGQATEATAGTEKVTKTTKNLFEANLKLANFAEKDPYVSIDPVIEESFQIFDSTAKMAPAVNMSDVYNDCSSEIWTYRKEVVAKVTMGEWTVDEAMAYYEDNCADMIADVLDSFNK